MASCTISVLPAAGKWEVLGVDRYPGIEPEGIEVSADRWGLTGASWTMRRPALVRHPDLAPFTKVVIEEAGHEIFRGEIIDKPVRAADDEISVSARGPQSALDDSLVERVWTHTDLTAWRDTRSFPGAQLVHFKAAGTVEAGDGAIRFGQAEGTTWVDSGAQGVTLDLGEGMTIPRHISIAYETENIAGSPVFHLYVRGSNRILELLGTAELEDAIVVHDPASSGTIEAVLDDDWRYLSIFLWWTGAGGTTGQDYMVTLTGITIASEAGYELDGKSNVKASDALVDAVNESDQDLAASLIEDGGQIEPTLLTLPSLAVFPGRTLREVFEGLNTLHHYRLQVGLEGNVLFAPQPTAPKFVTGAWSTRNFDDAGDTGEPIYNRVVMYGQAADGSQLRVERWAGQLPEVPGELISSPGFLNPSADVNATGWNTSSGGSVSRITTAGFWHSSPGAIVWSGFSTVAAETIAAEPAPGSVFLEGVSYRLTLRIWGLGTGVLRFGTKDDYAEVAYFDPAGSGFNPWSLVWRPGANHVMGVAVDLGFRFEARPGSPGLTAPVYIDSLALDVVKPTALDQQGRVRTAIVPAPSGVMTREVMTAFCDAYLRLAMLTPYKGGGTFSPGDLEHAAGGAAHPRELLAATQELIHFSQVDNPDTGLPGRNAAIASATYRPADEQAAVQLDNERDTFAALIARHGAIAGGAPV